MTAETITAAEANRKFSELLRKVRDGQTVVVTVHGKPAAKIVAFSGDAGAAGNAHRSLVTRLSGQPSVNVGGWTRASLYQNRK